MRIHHVLPFAALAVAVFGCASQGTVLPAEMRSATWMWTGLTAPAETIVIDDPARYTISFVAEGRVHLRADCNRGSGPYTVGAGGQIAFGAVALTRMACPPGSLSDRFVQDVERATSYVLQGDVLFLEQPAGSGRLRFERTN